MEGLIRMIAENPFILLPLIFILLSIFGGIGNANRDEGGGQQRQRPQRQPARDSRDNRNNRGEDEVSWRDIILQESEDTHPTDRQPRAESEMYRTERSDSRNTPSRDEYAADNRGRRELAESNDQLSEQYSEMKARKKEAERRAKKLGSDSPLIEKEPKKKSRIELDFSEISGEDAVKGVVWSEILGPPKGRRGAGRGTGGYPRRRQGS
ncbi:hypothetical protein [Alteribacter natronophilus]|uniref:hypothetical protein n=1 Tax=Alteribacter natronophilus TaxID=2583810 RepID=UPI00110E5E66|nr:hypothetical protein [Alteribacter natronophilus]TMW73859.1 hypothetical protein FGB90_06160 [Alteribacter natronophilus]